MEGYGEIRLEALRALTILATHDDEFRRGVWADLEGTLARYGFDLSDEEMARVSDFRDAVVNGIDEEVLAALTQDYR
jgi:hypothetical protein